MPDNLPILFPDAKVRPSFAFPGVSVFTIIQAAGWPIYFLLLTSIIAVALIIERTTAMLRRHGRLGAEGEGAEPQPQLACAARPASRVSSMSRVISAALTGCAPSPARNRSSRIESVSAIGSRPVVLKRQYIPRARSGGKLRPQLVEHAGS